MGVPLRVEGVGAMPCRGLFPSCQDFANFANFSKNLTISGGRRKKMVFDRSV